MITSAYFEQPIYSISEYVKRVLKHYPNYGKKVRKITLEYSVLDNGATPNVLLSVDKLFINEIEEPVVFHNMHVGYIEALKLGILKGRRVRVRV